MKKILLLLIALASAISLVACDARGVHTDTETIEYDSPFVENQDTYEILTDRANPTASYKLGDVNKDGSISNSDILLLYKYMYNQNLYPLEDGTTPSPLTLGDVNKDGKISNSDVLLFYKYIYNSTLYPFEEKTEEETTEPPFMGGGVWM